MSDIIEVEVLDDILISKGQIVGLSQATVEPLLKRGFVKLIKVSKDIKTIEKSEVSK